MLSVTERTIDESSDCIHRVGSSQGVGRLDHVLSLALDDVVIRSVGCFDDGRSYGKVLMVWSHKVGW
jgi:hypothetical protein